MAQISILKMSILSLEFTISYNIEVFFKKNSTVLLLDQKPYQIIAIKTNFDSWQCKNNYNQQY